MDLREAFYIESGTKQATSKKKGSLLKRTLNDMHLFIGKGGNAYIHIFNGWLAQELSPSENCAHMIVRSGSRGESRRPSGGQAPWGSSTTWPMAH